MLQESTISIDFIDFIGACEQKCPPVARGPGGRSSAIVDHAAETCTSSRKKWHDNGGYTHWLVVDLPQWWLMVVNGYIYIWLVVDLPLWKILVKSMIVNGKDCPIYIYHILWKIENIWNHQPNQQAGLNSIPPSRLECRCTQVES